MVVYFWMCWIQHRVPINALFKFFLHISGLVRGHRRFNWSTWNVENYPLPKINSGPSQPLFLFCSSWVRDMVKKLWFSWHLRWQLCKSTRCHHVLKGWSKVGQDNSRSRGQKESGDEIVMGVALWCQKGSLSKQLITAAWFNLYLLLVCISLSPLPEAWERWC